MNDFDHEFDTNAPRPISTKASDGHLGLLMAPYQAPRRAHDKRGNEA